MVQEIRDREGSANGVMPRVGRQLGIKVETWKLHPPVPLLTTAAARDALPHNAGLTESEL
jgi:hypothetical protein